MNLKQKAEKPSYSLSDPCRIPLEVAELEREAVVLPLGSLLRLRMRSMVAVVRKPGRPRRNPGHKPAPLLGGVPKVHLNHVVETDFVGAVQRDALVFDIAFPFAPAASQHAT